MVLADQDGGVVGVKEAPLVGAFLSDPVGVGDGGAVVGAADPLVVGAELEAGRLGACLTALRVANRVAVSTPLRIRSLTSAAVVSVVVMVVRLLAVRRLAMAVVRSVLSWVRAVASFRWAVLGSGGHEQALAWDRPGGQGRRLGVDGAPSCFCSSMKAGTGG